MRNDTPTSNNPTLAALLADLEAGGSKTRPYIAEHKDGRIRLIDAASDAQALRYAMQGEVVVRLATKAQIAHLVAHGILPERVAPNLTPNEEAPKPERGSVAANDAVLVVDAYPKRRNSRLMLREAPNLKIVRLN